MAFSTLKLGSNSMANIQEAIDIVSHNIANVNTTAYKEKNVTFEGVVNSYSSNYKYSGVAMASTNANFSQGRLKETGEYTDLMLQGNGFFNLQSSTGDIVYTRDGHFNIDATNTMVSANGDYVLSTGGGKIVFPPNLQSVEINASGEVKILPAGETEYQLLAQLQLATFTNPKSLESLGHNQYRETVNSGPPEFTTGLGTGTATAETSVVSGALEMSNAELSTSMVDLIAYQRSYQAASKAVQTANEVLQTTLALGR